MLRLKGHVNTATFLEPGFYFLFKQTRLCRSSVPHNKNYSVEFGPHTKEIEMGTRARALSFGFDFTLPYLLFTVLNMNMYSNITNIINSPEASFPV